MSIRQEVLATMTDKTLRTFQQAVAVITGAASGIGRALAEELARRGSEVILADLQAEVAEEVVLTIRAGGGVAHAFRLDVSDASAVGALLCDTAERTGRLDYLFNNAGIGIGGPISLHTLEDWDRILGVNLRGVIHGVHAAIPIMLEQGFGHIINTASMAGLMPAPGTVAYAATKHAVIGLSLSLRAELARSGIRVSVLCPGVVRTPMLDGGGRYGKVYSGAFAQQQREMMEQLRPMAPDRFARKALDAIAGNRAIVVVPSWWRLFWWAYRLSPAGFIRWAMMQYEAAFQSKPP
jgi:NAD(P)-dependent dehydrogenase (short-subunit alcohol dehydrogenase family)